MKKITVETKDKKEEMSIDNYVRWLCLMESVAIVIERAEKININPDKDLSWIKPIAFQKYMDDRFTSMKHEVELDMGIFKGGLERLENKNLVLELNDDTIDEVEEEPEIEELEQTVS